MKARNLNPEQILVTVPTRGQVQVGTIARLQEIRDNAQGLPPILYVPGHLSTAETRNRIINHFIDGPWEVLMMVDDDTVPGPDFLQLASLTDEYAVVGEPYLLAVRPPGYWNKFVPARSGPEVGLVYCAYDRSPEGFGLQIDEDTWVQVADPEWGDRVAEHYAVCSGAIALSRDALLALCGEYGRNPWQFSYFNNRLIGSDVTLCHRLRKLGYKIGVYWDEVADHQTVVSLETVQAAVST